ncbi:hypothetical protein NP493_904g00106 [Ridgeia piscesae]|uniref:NADH dehydrogenase [ubiquinone] 1 alpha subcomplex subunit 13 n=1 Tax=Ridgeia piscesae TaxID=27915 RepID=A0AAD9KKZ0_RIDPI|nr:hypothetical protein NP493_904g00106 [Ridgeia piscesae]
MPGMKFRQDMPPPGGYGPVEWAQKIPRRGLSGYAIFGVAIGISSTAWILYHFERNYKRRYELDMNDARIALEPLLEAERHRAFLKQLRKNRDEENMLMKDVPGWETGTLYGEPCYHNQAKRFPDVKPEEYFIHSRWADMYDRIWERRKH